MADDKGGMKPRRPPAFDPRRKGLVCHLCKKAFISYATLVQHRKDEHKIITVKINTKDNSSVLLDQSSSSSDGVAIPTIPISQISPALSQKTPEKVVKRNEAPMGTQDLGVPNSSAADISAEGSTISFVSQDQAAVAMLSSPREGEEPTAKKQKATIVLASALNELKDTKDSSVPMATTTVTIDEEEEPSAILNEEADDSAETLNSTQQDSVGAIETIVSTESDRPPRLKPMRKPMVSTPTLAASKAKLAPVARTFRYQNNVYTIKREPTVGTPFDRVSTGIGTSYKKTKALNTSVKTHSRPSQTSRALQTKYKIGKPKEIKMFKCEICDESFRLRRLRNDHILREHPDTPKEALPGLKSKKHKCELCPQLFRTRKALQEHHNDQHPDAPPLPPVQRSQYKRRAVSTKLRDRKGKPKICGHCAHECPTMTELCEHLAAEHDENAHIMNITFGSAIHFEQWFELQQMPYKRFILKDNNSKIVRDKRGRVDWICNRSGVYHSVATKRTPRKSRKCGFHCSAFISAMYDEQGKIHVAACLHHYKHDEMPEENMGKYVCPDCGYKLNARISLYSHRAKKHPEIVAQENHGYIICGYCSKTFRRTEFLCDHLAEEHDLVPTVMEGEFEDEHAFHEWRKSEAKRGEFKWTQTTNYKKDTLKSRTFKCSYSRSWNQDENKISCYDCSAFIRAKTDMETGQVTAIYCLDHYGHDLAYRPYQNPEDVVLDEVEEQVVQVYEENADEYEDDDDEEYVEQQQGTYTTPTVAEWRASRMEQDATKAKEEILASLNDVYDFIERSSDGEMLMQMLPMAHDMKTNCFPRYKHSPKRAQYARKYR